MANLFEAIASAAANIATQIKDYIDNVALVEKDPTVPAWAKQPLKPGYSADEIGGLSAVAKTGDYEDLLGAPHVDFIEGEFYTGRKWIDGRKIYARTAQGLAAITFGYADAVIVQLIPIDEVRNISYLSYSGTLTGLTDGEETVALGTTSDALLYLDLTSGKLTVSRAGAYNVLVYYIKTNE